MEAPVRNSFRDALTQGLLVLAPLVERHMEPWLVWRSQPPRGWQGTYEQRPSLLTIFSESRGRLAEIDAPFLATFQDRYPRYGDLVGIAGLGRVRMLHQSAHVLSHALLELWRRHRTFILDDGAVEAIVNEFERFVDLARVQLRFSAPLLNFVCDVDRIELSTGLTIRRLTDNEVTELHGGSLVTMSTRPNGGFGIQEFVVEGSSEERIVFGNEPDEPTEAVAQARSNLDRLLIALRTFKKGRVGYDSVRYASPNFVPLLFPSLGYGDLYIPQGTYSVTQGEVESLQRHYLLIQNVIDNSLGVACSRLSDAETRVQPRDQVIDAVIGLEALLLAGMRTEDRRGELRYRFSLHYSTLTATPEQRLEAFRIAKDLYDLRSTLAHGGMPEEGRPIRVGGERLPTLGEAADRACAILRDVVRHFLPSAADAPYRRAEYWENAYFGIETH